MAPLPCSRLSLNAGWREIGFLEDLALRIEGGYDRYEPTFVRGMSSVDSQWLTVLSHCLLSQLNESLLVWRSWAWKELNVAVLRAEHIPQNPSIYQWFEYSI